MTTRRERRHVARLIVPAQLGDPRLGFQQVRLVDLSLEGARIEHFRPLPKWTLYFLDLPRALGGTQLQGEVVWSSMGGRKAVAAGKRLVYYQSGLSFRWLTPEQRSGLTAALQVLEAAREAPSPEQADGTVGEAPGAGGEKATGQA
jgi:hypothetical protein